MTKLTWTNSALQSIKRNNLSQNNIYDVIHYADHNGAGREAGTTIFHKSTGAGLITVVGKYTQNKDWLILACWVKNSKTSYRKPYDSRYKNASFLKKILLDLLGIFKL